MLLGLEEYTHMVYNDPLNRNYLVLQQETE